MNVSHSLAGPQLSEDMMYLVNATYCSLETEHTSKIETSCHNQEARQTLYCYECKYL